MSMHKTVNPASAEVVSAHAPTSLTTLIREHIAENRRLRHPLPEHGRIYLERQLPFLTVYRKPTDRSDPGCDQFITSQAAYIIGSRSDKQRPYLTRVIREICTLCHKPFGAFLLVEIWSRPPAHAPINPISEVPTPAFRLFSSANGVRVGALLDVLEHHLHQISVGGVKAQVSQTKRPNRFPERPKPFFKDAEAEKLKCVQLGIEIEPIFQQNDTDVFPDVLKLLRRKVGYALQHCFFHFAEHQTELRPKNFHSLGRRALVKSVWLADAKLHEIAASFDFLREINPVNIETVWRSFKKTGYDKMPPLRYRPLTIDPGIAKRALFSIPIEKVEDPTISYLFLKQQAELDRKLTMLSDRGTSRFVLGSRQLYGNLSATLVQAAETILEKIPAYRRDNKGGHILKADELVKLAENELAYYRTLWPEASSRILIRPDVIAGLMVSNGQLLISENSQMSKRQADALMQHEVGTHLVTYFNGRSQRLAQLSSGLANYEPLQEGLAVLAEYLVGGLTSGRMRTLAARVIGTKVLIDGGDFIDCFRLLSRYGFQRRSAFNITVRLYRGGGLTKDAIYLRGLNEVLKYLRDGGDLPQLFVGKIATNQIPFITELLSRKVISPPRLMPRYLQREDCQERLMALRQGVAVHELLEFDSE
jgi:uncharacterized protein (TIGR02421 family)